MELINLHAGEADEVGTETEAGTLAGSNSHARGENIEDGEDSGGENGHSGNLTHRERLLGDESSSKSYSNTLNKILYDAS
jgi:hypothetical protein